MSSSTPSLKQLLRRLRRAPLFTLVTVLTLGVGIGANTAVFSVVEGVLLKPLPYPGPDALVGLWHVAPGLNLADVNMAPSNYFIYREQNRTFQEVGLYHGDSVSVTGASQPEQVPALDVTEGTLPILGIAPELGRWFNEADVRPGSPDTAILTYGYWRDKFGGEASIIGRTITADGKPRQIIGVMPRRFQFLDWQTPAVILPIQLERNETHLGQFSYDGVARLKPGVTIAEANRDVARMIPIVWESFAAPPGFSTDLFKHADLRPDLRSLKTEVVGDAGKVLWIVMGGIGVVLLIACANVANLMLVRAEGRQYELAIRSALGASWRRLAGELLLESLVVGLLGSVVGLGLAFGALRVLAAIAPAGLPRIGEIGIDLPVVLFSLVASLLASLVFGSISVLRYAGVHAFMGLREGRTLSPSRERHRARNTLVVVQVGLAFVLLVFAGLVLRTFDKLTHVDPGFVNPTQLQTFRLTIPEAEIPAAEQVTHMQEAILRKIAGISDVSSVALTSSLPLNSSGDSKWMDPVFAENINDTPGETPPLRRFKFVSPGFFSTLGTPLIAGRDFTWAEVYQNIPVAMVSENFAREYWHDPANALGKRVRVATKDDWREIVAVVGNLRDDGLSQEAPTAVYWPTQVQHFEGDGGIDVRRSLSFVIRSPRAGSENLMKDVRQAVWSVDANLPLAQVRTLEYLYRISLARTSFVLVLLGIAAGMALSLGSVGLYGVIAYSVSQRTREIGIRIALGAQQARVAGMFVGQGLLLAAVGVICGLAVALVATRLLTAVLFNVSPSDPLTYVVVCLTLLGTAVVASYIPSQRASATDPTEALRAE